MPKKIVGEPFSKSLVSGIEKIYASEGYVTIFCQNFFSLTVPKYKVDEPFCAVFEKNNGSESLWIRRREYHHFLSNIFCLTVPKKFVGETFSKSLVSGIEKIYVSDGYVTFFCQKFFVSQYRNIS